VILSFDVTSFTEQKRCDMVNSVHGMFFLGLKIRAPSLYTKT